MNKKGLIPMYNGSNHTKAEELEAKVCGVVVVFGPSDNLIEFRMLYIEKGEKSLAV